MEKYLRKLARSSYWQTYYSQAKELGALNLFKNSNELTKIQIIFLNWLAVYNSLYKDLSLDEDYISEAVIEDDLRTDAYLLWRRKIKYKKKKTDNKEKVNHLGIPSVVFKSKRK